VTAVEAALTLGIDCDIYHVCDGHPPTRGELYSTTAELLSAPEPAFLEGASTMEANRRLSNAKLRERLHWRPQYPSFREGLVQALTGSHAG